MKRTPSCHQKPSVWLSANGKRISSLFSGVLFLCLSQWVTVGVAQSSTGLGQVPSITIRPSLDTAMTNVSPGTSTEVQATEVASSTSLHSQTMLAFRAFTSHTSPSSHFYSSPASIMYSSDSIFYSSAAFSNLTTARYDSIFIGSSMAITSLTTQNSILQSRSSAHANLTQAISVFARPSSSLPDQQRTSDSGSLVGTRTISMSPGIDLKSSNKAPLTAHISTLPVSMSRAGNAMPSSGSTTAQLRISTIASPPFSSLPSVTTTSSQRLQPSTSNPHLPSVTTLLSQGLQPSSSNPSLASVSTVSSRNQSASSPSLSSVNKVASQPLPPSASHPFLPSVTTASSQSLQPSALTSSLPSVTTALSQPLQPSLSNPSRPSVTTVLSQPLQPSISNPSLPSVTTVLSQPLQPSLSSPFLPSLTTVLSQPLQPSLSNPSLPSVTTVLSQPLQPSLSNPSRPSVTILASNPSLPSVTTVLSQLLQPSLSNPSRPSVTILASNPSLPSVTTALSQPLQPSLSNPSLPSVTILASNSSLLSVTTVLSQPLQPSLSNPSRPSVTVLASNPSLPSETTASSQSLQPSALNPSLPPVTKVLSPSLQPSLSNPSLPSVTILASNPSLQSETTASSQSLQASALNPSLPSVTTVLSQPLQSSLSNPSLPSVTTVLSQPLQPSLSNPSLPAVTTVLSQPLQPSLSNPFLPSVTTVLSQPLQPSLSNPSLPSVTILASNPSLQSETTASSQSLQASALNPSLPSVTTVLSQPLQPSLSNPSLPSVTILASNPSLPSVTTVLSQPLQPSLSNPSLPSVTTVSSQPLQPSLSSPSLPSVTTVLSQPLQSSLSNRSLPSVTTMLSQPLQPSLSNPSLPSVTTVFSQPLQSSLSNPSLPSVTTVLSQPLQPSLSNPSLPAVTTVLSQPLQPSLSNPSLPSVTTVLSQPLQPSLSNPSLPSVATVSSQPLQPSLSSSSLPSGTTVVSQPLQPSLSNPSLPAVTTVLSQPLQPSLSNPSLPSVTTVLSQPLQPSLSNPSLASVTTVLSQPLQPSLSNPSLPSVTTVLSQPLQPSISNPSLPSVTTVLSQPLQPSLSNPSLPSVTTVSSQPLQPSSLNSSLPSVSNLLSRRLQPSASNLSLPSVTLPSVTLPSVTTVSSQSLQPSSVNPSLPSLPNVSSQALQPASSNHFLPSATILASNPSLPSVTTISSQPIQPSLLNPSLPTVAILASSPSLPSVTTVSSQQLQPSSSNPFLPPVTTVSSQPLQRSAQISSLPTASSQSSLQVTLNPSLSTLDVVFSQLSASPSSFASIFDVLTSPFQPSIVNPSLTAAVVSHLPVITASSQSIKLSQQSGTSTNLPVTSSQSDGAVSSIVTMRTGQDNTVYSSLYPCWISYYIEQTMYASAIYPNQSLFTTLPSEASSSYAFSPNELVSSDVPASKLFSVSASILKSSAYGTGVLSAIPSISTAATNSLFSIARAVSKDFVGSSITPTALVNSVKISSASQSYRSYQNPSSIPMYTTAGLLSPLPSTQESTLLSKTLISLSADQAISGPTDSFFVLPSSVNIIHPSTAANNVAKKRRRRDVLIASNGVTSAVSQSASIVLTTSLGSFAPNFISVLSSSLSSDIIPGSASSSNLSESKLTVNSQPDLSFQSTARSVNSQTVLHIGHSLSSTGLNVASSIEVLPSSKTAPMHNFVSTFSQNMQGTTSYVITHADFSPEASITSPHRQTPLSVDSISASIKSNATTFIPALLHPITSIINGSPDGTPNASSEPTTTGTSTQASQIIPSGTSSEFPERATTGIKVDASASSDTKPTRVVSSATARISALLSSIISGPNQISTTFSRSMQIVASNASSGPATSAINIQASMFSNEKFTSAVSSATAAISLLPSSMLSSPNQSSTTLYRSFQIGISDVSRQLTTIGLHEEASASPDNKLSSVIQNSTAPPPVSVLPSSETPAFNQLSTTVSRSISIGTSLISLRPTKTELYLHSFSSSNTQLTSVISTNATSVFQSNVISALNHSSNNVSLNMLLGTSIVTPQLTTTGINMRVPVSSAADIATITSSTIVPIYELPSTVLSTHSQLSTTLSPSIAIVTAIHTRTSLFTTDAKFTTVMPDATAPMSALPSSVKSPPNSSLSMRLIASTALPQPTTTGMKMQSSVSYDAKFTGNTSNATAPFSVSPSSVIPFLDQSSSTLSTGMPNGTLNVSHQPSQTEVYLQTSVPSDTKFTSIIPSTSTPVSAPASLAIPTLDQLSTTLLESSPIGTLNAPPQVSSLFRATTRIMYVQTSVSAESISNSSVTSLTSPKITTDTILIPLKPSSTIYSEITVGTVLPLQPLRSSLDSNQKSDMISSGSASRSELLTSLSANATTVGAADSLVSAVPSSSISSANITASSFVGFSTESAEFLRRTQATIASINASIPVSFGKKSVLAVSRTLGQSPTMMTSILQPMGVPSVASLVTSSINISSEVLSSMDLCTSIMEHKPTPAVSSQTVIAPASGSILASTAPSVSMYESSKLFTDNVHIASVNSQSQVKATSLELSLHISASASKESSRSSPIINQDHSLSPTLPSSLISDIPTHQSSGYLTVSSNLLSPSFDSYSPSTGILKSSYSQEPVSGTARLSTEPTVLTSKDVPFGTIALSLSRTYPVQATPGNTTTIRPSLDFSRTLRSSPSATSDGGVVRVLTSSLGQCIAYYTSNFQPRASSTQSSDSLLSAFSVEHTSVVSSSISTEISTELLIASATAVVNTTSTFPPTLSSQTSTGGYFTETSSLLSHLPSSDRGSISKSDILSSSLVSPFESSLYPLISASLSSETVTVLSTANLPIVVTSSIPSSENMTSVYTSVTPGYSVMQTSISRSSLYTIDASESSSIGYGSGFVSRLTTVSLSSVDASSSIVLYDSPHPTTQASDVPSSRLPLASSAVYPTFSASPILTQKGSISSQATPQIQTSSILRLVTIISSIYSAQKSSPSNLITIPSVTSEAASSISPKIDIAATNLISSTDSPSIPSTTLTSTTVQQSSAIPATQPPVTTQPVSVGLCSFLLSVPQSVDVTTQAFKFDMETKLLKTYLALKVKRRKRAVTEGSTTLNVTSIIRQGSTTNVDTRFYVTENNVIVSADRTSSTFNQLTTAALSSRLNQTVVSTVAAAGLTTQPTAITTINPPMEYQLLGMVLRDDASNNISIGNNKQNFETTMTNHYKSGRNISGVVTFTAYYIKHEVKNIVYLEFFVTIDNTRQNSSTIASFYSFGNPPVSPATLSALLKSTVITVPYSISSITASDIYQVVMTIRPVNANTHVNTNAFKNDLALRISAAYREGKDTTTARRKRRALGSISTTILSVLSTTNNQASVKFFILDQGTVVIGTESVSILNRLGINRMSSLLGVEVIVLPAAVSIPPVPATSEPDLWIIGVVLGACLLMIIFFAVLYWRWQAGAPKGKLDLEKIHLAEKGETATKSYGGYRDIAKYTAEGRSEGAPGIKTTAFIEPADGDEKPDMSRSIRRKGAPNDAVSRGVGKELVNGRKNTSYEESEEEYEDDDDDEDEDEDDEDDYESDIPPPRKSEASRTTSAQRKVEVQPGPTRDSRKVTEKVQRRDAGTMKHVVDEEETEAGSEDEIQKKRELPAAAELPPLSKMKDVQEAPTYPPVRFRTNIEPESSRMEPLPPISKHISLTAKPLPSIDPELRQKTDLERSRNKQRQRLRASGKWNGTSTLEATKSDRRAWRKAQSDIDALLDPFSASLKQSPRSAKRAKRRHRLRRSNKVDITIDGVKKGADENKDVKLNNYMKLDSPTHSMDYEMSPDMVTDDEKEKTIEDARERIHNLLDDAFSLLDPYQYARKSPREKVSEKVEAKSIETQEQQAPPEMETEQPKYPALPAPPHGRATTPLPGGRRRVINYPFVRNQQDSLPLNEPQTLAPVMTRDPMVVMDRGERNRYLSQRLGNPEYNRPYDSLSYPYSQTPSDQPVYITPVQQQPDNMAGVIWSPYTTEILREDANSTTIPHMNAIGSPHRNQYSMRTAANASTPSKAFESMRPRHTSIDMSNPVYDSQFYGSSPQPLIRAIKDELLRLSRNAAGKTKIQELSTSQNQGHSSIT